ncbi:pentapeptide MXKDX repeat protein [Burkholderia sp. Ac-20353]|uniref:pentapeptide MXKDX repeat protein n=1 Tax=Burkholderia sp. Ac-20353 TaxID=2703894 RepID=UPI00197B5073|nr:pentapeptide MXKDX repeat protein [Burkholderia sp. Ac-20353]MBN3792406.1 pentapeptide MXKDX repeat protein [Burkholderia sp. Ac-20353]
MKKNLLIAACLAGFAFAATGAYAQSDAMSKDQSSMSKDQAPMSKDAMGHDEMSKDNGMKKGAMAKHEMKKKGAMSHDSMGKPMNDDKSNNKMSY